MVCMKEKWPSSMGGIGIPGAGPLPSTAAMDLGRMGFGVGFIP